MARLVTKFKYLRPSARHNVGGYARYIATREGVEKIDDTYKLGFVSGKQKQLIAKILKDFPDAKDMHEYEDYLKTPNVGNASEFISRALEMCIRDRVYTLHARRKHRGRGYVPRRG